MGRWAQRRLRAGSGVGPVAPTPNPVTLLSVRGDGTDWVLTFDGPIVTDPGATPDTQFQVDAVPMDSVAPAVGSACTALYSGGPYNAGSNWDMFGQPNWLLTPLAAPSSGTTI